MLKKDQRKKCHCLLGSSQIEHRSSGRKLLGEDQGCSLPSSTVEAHSLLSCLQGNGTAARHIGKILEGCYLLISLLFLRSNKPHFFVFLFGANFLIIFYSSNLFDQCPQDPFQILSRCIQGPVSTFKNACPVLSLKG